MIHPKNSHIKTRTHPPAHTIHIRVFKVDHLDAMGLVTFPPAVSLDFRVDAGWYASK